MLSAGARIAVVAPSGIFDPDRLAASVALVRSWGLEVVPAPHLHARHRFTAGTAPQRLADLVWAWRDPGIDAVWFARGGFGTAHLLPDLPWEDLPEKPILGFSDATALLCALRAQGRRGGIHGPVLHSLADGLDAEFQEDTRRLLTAGGGARLPGYPLCGPARAACGPVVGGNLCVLASLAGTPWALRASGCIVVLEDVGEPAYKLDRLVTQLVQSGALAGAAGVALGEFVDCKVPPGADWTIEQVLAERLAPLGVPVVAGLPVGHGRRNRPWRHGALGELGEGGLDVGVG